VLDSKTGQDITAKVLAQIIIELDPPKLDVFPVGMLHRLLRSNEKLAAGFLDTFFSQPLSAYLNTHRSAEKYFRQAMGIVPPAPASPSEEVSTSRDSSNAELREMIGELRSQLDELRAATRAGRRRRAGAKSRSRKRPKRS
jgi:polyhydroxyalkanoate synthesis regulator protein